MFCVFLPNTQNWITELLSADKIVKLCNMAQRNIRFEGCERHIWKEIP